MVGTCWYSSRESCGKLWIFWDILGLNWPILEAFWKPCMVPGAQVALRCDRGEASNASSLMFARKWLVGISIISTYFNIFQLVGGLEHFLYFHILELLIPIDYYHIFQRGRVQTTNQNIFRHLSIIPSWHLAHLRSRSASLTTLTLLGQLTPSTCSSTPAVSR